MTLTTPETQFIALTKSTLSGARYLPEAADYSTLFTLAKQQKLLPILYEYLRQTPAAVENAALFADIKPQVVAQVLNQTVRSMKFSALYRSLRAAGLHPIVVKGQLCSRLYPMRDYRISADDDLLIPEAELLACHKALLENGLSTSCPEEELAAEDEISYTKKGSPLYIELHHHLFDSSEDAYDELNHFFADVHARAVEIDGFLSMPPHEHLLYLILHAYKHFVSRGIGLRQFCDIGLWARTYHDDIDWELLHEQCAGVHAATFASVAFDIARNWLGIDFDLPGLWETEVSAEPLLHDTLCGGVYGSNDLTRLHSSTVTLNAVKSNRKGKRGSVLSALFPNRQYMERKYPYVKKMPILLPAAWGQRAVHYLHEKRQGSSTNNSATGSIQLAKERIALMKLYGVIE